MLSRLLGQERTGGKSADHDLFESLLDFLFGLLQSEAPAPARPQPERPKVGTTQAGEREKHQAAVDARHRPNVPAPAPKRPEPDRLAAVLDDIAMRYLSLTHDSMWARARRSRERAEAMAAEALTERELDVPDGHRAQIAREIIRSLEYFSGETYGWEGTPNGPDRRALETPTSQDEEFRHDFVKAAEAAGMDLTTGLQTRDEKERAWTYWRDEIAAEWRHGPGPKLVARTRKMIRTGRQEPPIAPVARLEHTTTRSPQPTRQGPTGPAQ